MPGKGKVKGASMTNPNHGIVTLASVGSVAESLDRLENLAKGRGMTVFARIDFSKDAAAVDMKLRTMQLLILGNTKGGTPLMQAVAGTALDLPLKVLAWQDDAGVCQLSFNQPEYLQQRHGFPPALMSNIAGLSALVEAAAKE
jgi:uncharacterized protein (DUF302 family)